MDCPLAHHQALQILHDHGPLTAEQATALLWPGIGADPPVTASFLAHLIDHGWVAPQRADGTFVLTEQGRAALVAQGGRAGEATLAA